MPIVCPGPRLLPPPISIQSRTVRLPFPILLLRRRCRWTRSCEQSRLGRQSNTHGPSGGAGLDDPSSGQMTSEGLFGRLDASAPCRRLSAQGTERSANIRLLQRLCTCRTLVHRYIKMRRAIRSVTADDARSGQAEKVRNRGGGRWQSVSLDVMLCAALCDRTMKRLTRRI